MYAAENYMKKSGGDFGDNGFLPPAACPFQPVYMFKAHIL